MQFEIQWQTVDGQIAPWTRMQEVMTALKDYEKKPRLKIPRIFTEVKVTVRRRRQTCISNLDAVSREFGHPLIYIMKYFSYQLRTMVYEKKGRVIIHGLHRKKKLYQLLKDFSQKFVLCPKCEKRAALSANDAVDTLQKRCRECDYEGQLYSTDKLSIFIWRNKTMKPMSERMRATLPKSKETNYAAKFKSVTKDALVAKLKPAVKVTKQNKNILSSVCEIPVNKQMEKKIIISKDTNYADKVKSKKKNTLFGNLTGPEVKATNQKKNILPGVRTISISKRRGKKSPKSKETNCADKLRSKKSIIVIKSTAPVVNATKLKKNRLPVVRDIPKHYMYRDIQDDEYLLSDFTDSEDYEYYLKKFEESKDTPIVENMVVESEELNTAACGKRKLLPKILISRIQKNVKEEDIIENIKDKNPWLKYLIKNEDDFKKVATLQADAKGRPSYIIKCSPQIRGNIALRSNKLNIQGGCYNVRDTYHVIRCTKCQKFGHKRDQCRGKLICPKCGKEHWLKDCDSETSTCLHCQGPHITGNRSCLKYKEQEARIKERTDHGEHLEYVMPDFQIEGTEIQQVIKQGARKKKKEKNKLVNMESGKKSNKAKSKDATDLGEQQVIPFVKSKKKQKKQLTLENNKVEEGTKSTPDQGEQQIIIPAVKSKKKKQKKQLTMENSKVKAEIKNTTDQGEQQVIKPVLKRKKKQKLQLTMENNNRVEAGIKNTTDHREQEVIIPVEEKMKHNQEMLLPLENNNNRIEEVRTKNTIALEERVIKPELVTARRYGKYLYLV